jgi:hypothetical protein
LSIGLRDAARETRYRAPISAAAAVTLTAIYGNGFAIKVTATALPRLERSLVSCLEAAQEASVSRIYNGNHTRIDQVAGEDLGRDVAQFALASAWLAHGSARPLKHRPGAAVPTGPPPPAQLHLASPRGHRAGALFSVDWGRRCVISIRSSVKAQKGSGRSGVTTDLQPDVQA